MVNHASKYRAVFQIIHFAVVIIGARDETTHSYLFLLVERITFSLNGQPFLELEVNYSVHLPLLMTPLQMPNESHRHDPRPHFHPEAIPVDALDP